MSANPIVAIENAELEAQQIVLRATAERAEIVQTAKETAHKRTAELMNQTELEAEKTINTGRKASAEQKQAALGALEKDLDMFKTKGAAKQEAAIKAVLALLPDLL